MVNAKNLPIFSANRNAAGKCTKFYWIYGYGTVYNIYKPNIYYHRSLGKSATVFFIQVTKNYRNWLPTYLIFSAIDIRLTNIRRLYIFTLPLVGKSTVSVYPTDFRCICKRHSYWQSN